MKAAVVTTFGAPLELLDLPIPTPGAGEVLVRVRASGVCHTDLHAARGDWPDKPALPIIPGHEAVGEVVEIGERVTSVAVGDRVGVPWLHRACGNCEACLSGWETLCPQQQRSGYDVAGGFAEYVVADAAYVAHIPHGIDFLHAAPLICAGLTVYKGLRMVDAKPGDWVVVSGIGGLGHLAVQYAAAMGFQVIATDIDETKLDLAASLGATMTINAKKVDPAGYIHRQIGGAHGALVTAVSTAAFGQALGMMRPGGTVVLNGVPPGSFSVNIYDLVMRAITMRGSIVGTRHDLSRALALAAQRNIRPTVHPADLSSINAILEKMANWPMPGRVVLEFP
ncbi:zinc-dependent alcohol dehydrogenase [Tessaracoccus antarcticus]|uniref:Alcohol dehydrogenase n=1 Tax=Tessaracoccus antarcticus TaxID=2479848 RepID=A0A3M0G5T1_9ACTN|nr:zinc-dependent alcohol dehydrogenase [Tessaracoccus antarcticus]RMB60245.1 zinc-dependent alcohol dehydrogenase [Tessaracoccus antarcticus]